MEAEQALTVCLNDARWSVLLDWHFTEPAAKEENAVIMSPDDTAGGVVFLPIPPAFMIRQTENVL